MGLAVHVAREDVELQDKMERSPVPSPGRGSASVKSQGIFNIIGRRLSKTMLFSVLIAVFLVGAYYNLDLASRPLSEVNPVLLFSGLGGASNAQEITEFSVFNEPYLEAGALVNTSVGNESESEIREPSPMQGLQDESIARPKRMYSSLERTSSRPYNILEPDERYLLYSPSGGYNNQILCLATAIQIAKRQNRTLIVPMAGRHSNMFIGYQALKQEECVPMDHTLDFAKIQSKLNVRLLALNTTIIQFYKDHLYGSNHDRVMSTRNTFVWSMTRAMERHTGGALWRMLTKTRTFEKQVLFLHGRFFKALLFAYSVIDGKKKKNIMHNLYPSPVLVDFAKRITDATFGEGSDYFSMHVRLGDFGFKFKSRRTSVGNYLDLAMRWNWHVFENAPIYVASEPGNKAFFEPLKSLSSKVYRAKQLMSNPQVASILSEFSQSLPESLIRIDTYGIVEQIICARARDFIGTKSSTFTGTIHIMRGMEGFKTKRGRGQSVSLVTPDSIWFKHKSALDLPRATKIFRVKVSARNPDAW